MATPKKRVTIKKYMGDDIYSWAVFVDGHVVSGLTGLNQRQAKLYKLMVEKQLVQQTKLNTGND